MAISDCRVLTSRFAVLAPDSDAGTNLLPGLYAARDLLNAGNRGCLGLLLSSLRSLGGLYAFLILFRAGDTQVFAVVWNSGFLHPLLPNPRNRECRCAAGGPDCPALVCREPAGERASRSSSIQLTPLISPEQGDSGRGLVEDALVTNIGVC